MFEDKYIPLKLAYDAIQAPVIVSLEGKIIIINNSGLKLFGLESLSDLNDKEILSIVCEKDKEKVNKLMKNEDNDFFEVSLMNLDNQEIIVSAGGKNLEYKSETLRVSTIYDLTSQYEFFRKYITEIRKDIIKELFSNIAHQWRQPLSCISVIASSRKIQKEFDIYDYDEDKTNDENIIKQVNILNSIINGFESLSKKNVILSEICLETAIKKALNIFSNKKLTVNFERKKISIKTNLNILISILFILIKNFNDIKDERKIDNSNLGICLEETEESAFIKLSDNLGGIDERYIDKIFDPYFTTFHEEVGKGLSLSIAKLMCEKIKADITVENVGEGDSKGAKFTIKIPKEIKEEKKKS